MKSIRLGLSVAFLILISSRVSAQDDLKQLEWMVGSWQQTSETQGYDIVETWKMVAPDRLEGQNVSKDNTGKVVSVETMIIAKRGNDYFFEAKLPSNRVPVAFKIDRITNDSFLCRNNRNVFPKQIIYSKVENGMTADLSGNGRLTQVTFRKIEFVISD